MNRRDFLINSFKIGAGLFCGAMTLRDFANAQKEISPKEFRTLTPPKYRNTYHDKISWKQISNGLEFSRTGVYSGNDLIDVLATLRINPIQNKIRVFNGYSEKETLVGTIDEWRKATGALAMINSAQYMAEPYYKPCALMICDGKQKGPKYNQAARGMLVAEPIKSLEGKIKQADLLDFSYDNFNSKDPTYQQGVQHWPILLDRHGKIKVKKSDWQANRTIVGKDNKENILFMTTEGGFFTLYNLGEFLKESNNRRDKGFNVHTAMNMDGGYEACMAIETPDLSYTTYGEFETYGPDKDATVFNWKIKIPSVIGVFKRD